VGRVDLNTDEAIVYLEFLFGSGFVSFALYTRRPYLSIDCILSPNHTNFSYQTGVYWGAQVRWEESWVGRERVDGTRQVVEWVIVEYLEHSCAQRWMMFH
jgi:hypothetical protein